MNKTELQIHLEEDLSTLMELLVRKDTLPPRHVRSVAAPIVRKWLIDKQLNKLAKELGVTLELPINDTSDAFEQLSNLEEEQIDFYLSGGVQLGGESISSIYSSPQEFTGEPLIFSAQNLILLAPEKFLNAKRIFYKNNIFNMNQIITFLSNKHGGVHFDRDYSKYKPWHFQIEEAAKYLKLGNPNNEDEIFLDEKNGYQLLVLPLEKGYEWNCLEIEILVAAQSLVNVYCNKMRLIDGDIWTDG